MSPDPPNPPEIILPVSATVTPEKAPAPPAPLSPAPDGLIHFTVTQMTWMTQKPGTSCQLLADAETWGTASAGSLNLLVNDTSLDHIRVGDRLTLVADRREAE